jgi:hypothetical protein
VILQVSVKVSVRVGTDRPLMFLRLPYLWYCQRKRIPRTSGYSNTNIYGSEG